MKERRGTVSKRLLLEILLAIALAAVLLAMLIGEVARAASAVSFERVRQADYVATDTLYGYLLRDESALRTNNNGPIRYLVNDGDAVQSGTPVAQVYLDDTASDKRERAAALSEQIREIDLALTKAEQTWQSNYLAAYAETMRDLSAGSPTEATAPAKALAEALMRRDGEREETAASLMTKRDALQAEWMALVEHVDAPQTVPAATDGIFYRGTDGLEALLGHAAAATLTPEGLEALLASPVESGDVIGKLISTGAWTLVLPVDAVKAVAYTAGECYTVHFERNDVSATMTLAQVTPSLDGTRALLILQADEAPAGLSPERRQCVRVERRGVSGLCIPAASLLEDNTVFVEENGVAKRLAVTPLLVQDGCVILKDVAPLRPGMHVLLATRRLYDGKVLN